MTININAEVEHEKLRDNMINFLETFGISVPNRDDFDDVELGNYIVEILRKRELADI